MYNDLFTTVPKPPVSPNVKVVNYPEKVVLDWGYDLSAVAQTETKNPLTGYDFQGYNVYQLPSPSASIDLATRIATYDLVDTVDIIKGIRFLPQYGQEVTVPVEFGTNSGIKRYIEITKDYINDRDFQLGNDYYFAVTAYNFNPAPVLIQDSTLESSIQVLHVVPQPPNPGTAYSTTTGETMMANHTSGVSDGIVQSIVIDPLAITGDDYEVYFTQDTSGTTFWNLKNTATGDVLATDQPILANVDDSDSQPITQGFQVKVAGPPVGINTNKPGPYGNDPTENGWNWDGTRWISGYASAGGPTFFGGLFNGADFFGSTITPTEYVDVNMEWASATDRSDTTAEGLAAASQSEEPDRWSKAVVYRRDLGYAVQPTLGMVPFALYDTSVDPPQRLKIAFVEDANNGSGNLLWDMGWDGSAFAAAGGREYLFLIKDPYDENYTDYLNGTLDGTYDGVLYAIWPDARGSHPYLEADFDMQVYASKVITPDDIYTFNFPAAQKSTALAKEDVKKVNVFPNPYYAFNSMETNRFDRFVTFSHLPQKATIRIFDLGGAQVVKLEKNSTDQFMKWDLKNQTGIPVASGIYIAYVEMPDLGLNKTLKVFIVQSEQIIKYY